MSVSARSINTARAAGTRQARPASGDMRRSCGFYSKLGLTATFGGPDAEFTTFSAEAPVTAATNRLHVNLVHAPAYLPPPPQRGVPGGWGRAVIFVDDVDSLQARLVAAGLDAPCPRDAPWGERCFHVKDPDGHELSFATPDYAHPRWDPATERDESALTGALDELLGAEQAGER